MQWQLVVFDSDGTLVDCQHAIVRAMIQAFKSHGLAEPSAELIRRSIGESLPHVLEAIVPRDTPIDMDKLAARYRETFIQIRMLDPGYHDPLYPGAREALDALVDAGVPLGIAAGKSRAGLEADLAPHGLLERFITIHTEESGAAKPAPDLLERAIADVGARADHTVMVGDSVKDVEMAREAGARVIGVTWGYSTPDELKQYGADAVIDDFAELVPTLERL